MCHNLLFEMPYLSYLWKEALTLLLIPPAACLHTHLRHCLCASNTFCEQFTPSHKEAWSKSQHGKDWVYSFWLSSFQQVAAVLLFPSLLAGERLWREQSCFSSPPCPCCRVAASSSSATKESLKLLGSDANEQLAAALWAPPCFCPSWQCLTLDIWASWNFSNGQWTSL